MSQNPGEFIPIARLSSRGPFGPGAEPSIQPEHGFHAIIDLVRRRKRFIAITCLIGTALAGVAAFVVPPTYTATAQFMFEPTQAQTAAGTLEPVVDTHIATLTSDARLRDVLKTLPNLPQYRVVESHLQSEIANPTLEDRLRGWLVAAGTGIRDATRPTPSAGDARQDGIGVPSLDAVKTALLVRQERRSNVITVSYTDIDPERAAIIANQIVQTHIDRLAERQRQQADSLRTWLDNRLKQAQSELDAAEEALRAHVSAHGTPSADAAAGEVTAEMSRQLEVVRSELLRREQRLEQVKELRRSGAPAAKVEALLREPLLGAQYPDAAAPSAVPGSQAEASSEPAALQAESERRLRNLEREIGIFRLLEQSLSERIASLQAASGAILTQRRERQAHERRAATAAEVVRDLVRQQQEPRDLISTGVQTLAEASVPLRPSSLSPYLYIPAAMIAFAMLGVMAASVRERMDRSFRSEGELMETLRIGCIGMVPGPPRERKRGRLVRRSKQYERAIEAVAALALELISHRGDGKILAITSTGPDDGKAALAAGIATYAARSQRRVLLIRAGAAHEVDSAAIQWEASPDGLPQGAAFEIRHDAAAGFDCLSLDEIGEIDTTFLVGSELANSLDKLRGRYDYMIIDAPGVFDSAGIRILAGRVDGVIFAVRWGSTHRDAAASAIDLLMKPALLGGGPRPNVFAVLTHVDQEAHAGYGRGESGGRFRNNPTRHGGAAFAWRKRDAGDVTAAAAGACSSSRPN